MSPYAAAVAAGLAFALLSYALLQAHTKPAPVEPGQRVVLLGDSIGVGFGGPLHAQMQDAGVDFASQATVGWTLRKALQAYEASDAGAEVVVLSLGSNDAALADPASEAGDAQQLVDLAWARGAKRVVWVTPPNFQIDPPPPPATKAKQEAFHDILVATSPRLEVLVPSDDVLRQLGQDRIHLTPHGYQVLASQVAGVLLF